MNSPAAISCELCWGECSNAAHKLVFPSNYHFYLFSCSTLSPKCSLIAVRPVNKDSINLNKNAWGSIIMSGWGPQGTVIDELCIHALCDASSHNFMQNVPIPKLNPPAYKPRLFVTRKPSPLVSHENYFFDDCWFAHLKRDIFKGRNGNFSTWIDIN